MDALLYHSNLDSRAFWDLIESDKESREKMQWMRTLQGYLAQKRQPPPLGPPQGTRHSRAVGSYGGAFSYERSTPADVLASFYVSDLS